MTMKRRTLLEASAMLGLTWSGFARGQNPEDIIDREMTLAEYGDPGAAAAWLRTYMEQKENAVNAVEGALVLGRFADRMYYLREEIAWEPDPGQEAYGPVTVPRGFVTDFASIPRALWSVFPPDGDYIYAAIIHDYLYWNQGTSRDHADSIFRFAMQDFELGSAVIAPIYGAVRVGGWVAWDGNAELKQGGEKRVLKSWPTDPTIKWVDWKRRPDVFV